VSPVVLVTGASGGIGRALLSALRGAGWTTRCLVHRRPVDHADELVPGDLRDVESLTGAVLGANAIIHLAATTHARTTSAYDRVNVEGTRALVRAAEAAAVGRFLHVSTRAISPEGGAYSRSKLRAEDVVRSSGIEHVIVRLPEVYGLGGSEGVDDIIRRAQRGSAIPVVGSGSDEICPVHADDVIPALVAALVSSSAANRTYTLAGECMSAREFAERCNAAFGSRSRIVGVPRLVVSAAAVGSRILPLPIFPDQVARLRAPKPGISPEVCEHLGFEPQALEAHLAVLAVG
jgi:nucleoside-diphosphate-sugar epimerase